MFLFPTNVLSELWLWRRWLRSTNQKGAAGHQCGMGGFRPLFLSPSPNLFLRTSPQVLQHPRQPVVSSRHLLQHPPALVPDCTWTTYSSRPRVRLGRGRGEGEGQGEDGEGRRDRGRRRGRGRRKRGRRRGRRKRGRERRGRWDRGRLGRGRRGRGRRGRGRRVTARMGTGRDIGHFSWTLILHRWRCILGECGGWPIPRLVLQGVAVGSCPGAAMHPSLRIRLGRAHHIPDVASVLVEKGRGWSLEWVSGTLFCPAISSNLSWEIALHACSDLEMMMSQTPRK